jgi:enoyl-[acyl-carrier protein] reductase I
MGLLTGKTALIFGVANDHSIAWGIAQAFHREGATLGFSYAGEVLQKRVTPLAASIGSTFVEPCDVANDEEIATLFEKVKSSFGQIDCLVHAIGFAPRDALTGPYYDTSRENFRITLDVSCYSFTALVRHALPHMRPGGSFLTLSYYGAEKAVPHYNVMGVAKAALEASVRYLAADLGPQNVRVNAISAGPIRTLAASGVAGFKSMYGEFRNLAPLRRNVTIEDVGNAALYLCSDLAAGVTGEVHYVDAGYNVIGVPPPESKQQ